MNDTRKMKIIPAVAAALALGLWLGLSSLAFAKQEAPHHMRHATVGTQHHAPSASVRSSGAESGSSDGFETESGNRSDSETESDTEGETAGENDTHEDPNGQDVNHECPPNCDTSAGEQP